MVAIQHLADTTTMNLQVRHQRIRTPYIVPIRVKVATVIRHTRVQKIESVEVKDKSKN